MFDLLKTRWQQLKLREKKALYGLAIILIILLLLKGYWFPITHHVNNLRQISMQRETELAWLQTIDPKTLEKLEKKSSMSYSNLNTPLAILDFLHQEIEKKGLLNELKELKQLNKNGVIIRFDNIAFDSFIALLTELLNQTSLKVSSLSINATKKTGIVKVNLIFNDENTAENTND